MNISELSIKRPVLTTVLMLVIIIFGVIGYNSLGVREFPSVDSPIITVSVSYPGANPEVVMNQITEPLEQDINGIPGIRSLSSTSSQGYSYIIVEFELEVDMERAANDVRDKVSKAQYKLPKDCDPPVVAKADADSDPVMRLVIKGENYSRLELTEFAEITVKERLQTINGVSAITIFGNRYSMRLWLDPIKMAAYGITPIDVKRAVDSENVELPSGNIEGDKVLLTIRTLGLMTTAQEFNDLVIKETDGVIIKLKDIGYAEVGAEDIRSSVRVNREEAVVLMIVPQPGANHIQITDEVYKRLDELEKDLPEGVETEILVDLTKFIRASINEVKNTIYVALLLVILIIFFFLRDWRVTLVPVMVIPVSLIGSFFVMYMMGFSINVLTMLALVLSVGLVVDDAIVVSENIYTKIEKGMKPINAGIEGSIEIFFAVISTTITLIAVFLPIVFMEGMTGRLFKEFSIVIAGAVIISSFTALTLTPMLATKILKRREEKSYLYRISEPFFLWLNRVYESSLSYFLKKKLLVIPIILGLVFVIIFFWGKVPSELAPFEDRSLLITSILTPEGSTFDYTNEFGKKIEDIIEKELPESNTSMVRVGVGNGVSIIPLVGINERDKSQSEVLQSFSKALSKETMGRAFVRQPATFTRGKSGMPIQYVLQAPNLEKLREYLPLFMEKVQDSPIFAMADANLKFTKPELMININRDKANHLGVNTIDVAQTLQYGLSGQRIGYYYRNGKQYKILGEIARTQRNTPLDLESLYIRNDEGAMIPVNNLVDMYEDVSSPMLFRYNRFVSATISSALAPGRTLSEGLDEMDKIAKEVLDDSFRTTLAGESKEFRDSSDSLIFAFILALVLIYLVLAAQFESFKDPLIMMLTVPMALAGALVFMYVEGVTMNVFSQIGLIMLIGLVVKNGILIVEFSNQRQDEGFTKGEAILTASVQRLRPILMTSFSTILGLLPLIFATGEGANGRISMGVSVVGGMLLATLLTLYVVPAIYGLISTDRTKKRNLKSLEN